MSTVITSTTELLPSAPHPWCAFFDGPSGPDSAIGFGATEAQALLAFAELLRDREASSSADLGQAYGERVTQDRELTEADVAMLTQMLTDAGVDIAACSDPLELEAAVRSAFIVPTREGPSDYRSVTTPVAAADVVDNCGAEECVLIVAHTRAISGEVDTVGTHVHPTDETITELVAGAADHLTNELDRRIAEGARPRSDR